MGREPIDVVIPVFNAPELTRACLESLYAHVPTGLGEVLVHDNASRSETARMLDGLELPGLRVHHAAENTGFGDAVNQGMARARSEVVLVLNSDVRASDDFVAPLADALETHPELVAVAPAGNTFAGYDLDRYQRRGDCVVTHSLYAYAFLVRRRGFLEAGGFDPVFGLGYYEDSDLSRRWIRAGRWLGVHPRSRLQHEIHGSFAEVPAARELMARNRRLYFERYPGARRRVLLVSGRARGEDLPQTVLQHLEAVLEEGGEVQWLARELPSGLLALGMRGERWSLRRAWKLLVGKRRKEFGRFTDLWLLDDAPVGARALPGIARRLALAREPWLARPSSPRSTAPGELLR